jgi:transcriptional regulator with XRE-family HTH domain
MIQSGSMDKKTFRHKRERLRLTQDELAKKLGKTRVTIARYELGGTPIPKAVEMALRFVEEQEKG